MYCTDVYDKYICVKTSQWGKLWYDLPVVTSKFGEQAVFVGGGGGGVISIFQNCYLHIHGLPLVEVCAYSPPGFILP